MKKIFLLTLLFSFQITWLTGQETNENNPIDYLNVTVDREQEIEKQLKQFADSLNNFSRDKVPSFLFEECLDWRKNLWKGLHKPISVRWEILSRVYNKDALEILLKQSGGRLKKKCSLKSESVYPNLKVPDINKSFYQLIKKRCLEL
jgi:hypothetical protein